MKNTSQSMSPRDAAEAFYGQDEVAFAEMVERIAINDQRLVELFKNTRNRFIEGKNA
jgi:hypothetical protein